jgi:esterase/lipase superfamily enzyme
MMLRRMADKETWIWPTERLPHPARVARWGKWGAPVLLFPSAGGDCEEVERFGVVAALEPLLAAGRLKLYSVDGIAARGWLEGRGTSERRAQLQNAFDVWIQAELVPHIQRDAAGAGSIVTAGAAFGAFDAVASLCRHPDVFRAAVGLSGYYDLTAYLGGPLTSDFYFSSPLHYLPALGDSAQLASMRERQVVIAGGDGPYEDARDSLRMAGVLGDKGIPHRIEQWGAQFDHDWNSWRPMLEKYLQELLF